MAGNSRSDKFTQLANNNAEVITPSDATVFSGPCHLVCFDGTSVRVMTVAGAVVDHPVVAGIMLPVLVTKVYATGTNATKIVAYW
jgi:hypothetical protein